MNSPDPVEELLARCLEQSEDHWSEAFRAACEEHPEHAAELRARWDLMGDLGIGAAERAEDEFPERLGDFRLLRRLGAGGMGVVYVAEQESLGRPVALKLIRPEHLYFPGARIRFRREVEAAGRLQHAGIVPVYLVGEEHGIPYFAMEWIQGCSLSDLLTELRSHTPEELSGAELAAAVSRAASRICGEPVEVNVEHEAFRGGWNECCVRLVRQVAAALQHAHERGVLHRDVKSSNILITAEGRALLVDFGLASSTEAAPITRSGSEVGSLSYMAPERFEGITDDLRSDLYSLGVTLYELLTLRMPFMARTSVEVKRRILEQEAPRVRALNSTVEWDLETVCQVAMEKDRSRRYSSAAELETDLVNLLEHRPITARRPGRSLRMRRWMQRHPAATVGIVLGMALTWGVPFMWWMQERFHREEVEQRLAERNRLKDHKLLRELLESEGELHPAGPDTAVALGQWLASATDVEERRKLHVATLERLQQELILDEAEDPEAWAWETDVLQQMLVMLDQVDAVRPEVESRHQFAQTVNERTLHGTEAVELWENAAFEIEESDLYGGMSISPQLGLLPLEPDPESGLWEFRHVQSGDKPLRDPETQRWVVTGKTGIIFVLIPGGTFTMGCEKPTAERPEGSPGVDPRCNPTGVESPPHEVTLSPFFLSKYEMTQGQWLRFTGTNPSAYHPDRPRSSVIDYIELSNPVEGVSWVAATRVVQQLGVSLPTESQWEYACRAGSTTVFHFGNDPALTPRFSNVLDKRWKKYGHERAEEFSDPFWQHAPVGSFEPNAFGLHDVHGNLYEWCADRWGNYVRREARAGDGLRDNPNGTRQRSVRGGAWVDGTLWARSAARHFEYEDSEDNSVGLRPARSIEPPAPSSRRP